MSNNFTIGNLVQVDEHATFRSDVQLDSFDEPQLNRGLVNSYLFSSALPASHYTQSTYVSPAGVLEKLVQSFISERLDNRFSLIATYGHGKSHLALALANYFGKPYKAPEVQTLLDKLGNALSPTNAARYKDFKESRGEFLVLRLRGDELTSLQEQVLSGLEKAFQEHEATKNAKLPFWFNEAERIIASFSPAEQTQANRYLQDKNLDIPLLQQQLHDRQEHLYELCIGLIKHVKGVRPDFGGDVNLGQVVTWVIETFCGRGKPLGGLLILFDEFTLYVERHARRNATGELQNLLNGVDRCRGKAVFLTFSQVDPMQVADNLRATDTAVSGLKKELGRIPQKMTLYSLMESVIEAYLIQDTKNWPSFLKPLAVRGPITQATDIVFTHFRKRYSETLRWSTEDVQERLTKGCFPLHPITTYMLCNLKLQSNASDAGTPRTILGFVLGELESRKKQPALINGLPNWILPIGLINYFGGRLGGDTYQQYLAARRTLHAQYETSDELNEAQLAQFLDNAEAILKGLLLQDLAEVSANRREQVDFIAHTAGFSDPRHAGQLLRQLSTDKILRFDTLLKRYTFWPATVRPEELERIVQQKLESFNWSRETVDDINATVNNLLKSFGSIDVRVKWGHASDWAAREYLLPVDKLTVEWLRATAKPFGYSRKSLEEGDRSVVLWLAVTEEAERPQVRDKVTQVFQEAFASQADTPPVVVAIIPRQATPELQEAYRRLWALQEFSQKERADAGQEMFDQELAQASTNLANIFNRKIRLDDQHAVEMMRPAESYMVPTAYITAVRQHKEIQLRELLSRLYETAFPYAPPEFFMQYKVVTRGALKTATSTAAKYLIDNNTNDLRVVASNSNTKPLGDLCDTLIRKWYLLSADYRLQEVPGSRRVQMAWKHIDDTIKPGNKEYRLREVLFPLLNPPFGYDYNTALLVFSAWFGYHHLDLEVLFSNQKVNRSALVEIVQGGSKDFFEAIAVNKVVSLRRRTMPDAMDIKKQLGTLDVQQSSQQKAQEQLDVWHERIEDVRYNEDLRRQMKQSVKQLQAHLTAAEKYDVQAKQIRTAVEQTAQPSQLVSQLTALSKLPPLGSVAAEEASPAELKTEIEARFTAVVEAFCQEHEEPTELTAVGLYRDRLQKEKTAIAKANLPTLVQRFDEALQRLTQREDVLRQAAQQQQQQQDWQTTLDSIDLKGRLEHLLQSQTTLDNLFNLPDKFEALRQTRLTQIKEAIQSIYDQVSQHRQTLATASQSADVDKVRDQLIRLQMICADTAVAPEINQLLSQTNERQQELAEQEKQIDRWRASIKSIIPRNSTLRQLQEGQSQLNAMADLPADVARLRDQKLHEVDSEIHTIQQQVADAQTSIERITSRTELEKYDRQLHELKQRCKETNAANELEQCTQQVANLRRFFSALEDERNVRLESPTTIREQNKRLEGLQTAYVLSEPQLHVLADAKAKLDTAVTEQQQKARQWLTSQQDAVQKAATSEQLTELIKRLDNPPRTIQFLPATEQQTVAALRQQVQKRIDDDTVTAIVTRFRQISDAELQAQCLQQLQDIWANKQEAH